MFSLMLVDDEPIILEGLMRTVDWARYDLRVAACARHGFEALDLLIERQPDAILTDIRMRFMDGLDFIRHAQRLLPDVVFLVLSAYDSFEYAQRACELGALGYLLKPVDEAQLDAALGRLLQELHRRHSLEAVLKAAMGMGAEAGTSPALPPFPYDLQSRLLSCFGRPNEAEILGAMDEFDARLRGTAAHRAYGRMLLGRMVARALERSGFQAGLCARLLALGDELAGMNDCQALSALRGALLELMNPPEALPGDYARSVAGKARAYIAAHLQDPGLNLRAAAQEMGLSAPYLGRVYKRVTGMSFYESVNMARIERARSLLLEPGARVGEVGAQVGFENTPYFHVLFKKVCGVTPGEYRSRRTRP